MLCNIYTIPDFKELICKEDNTFPFAVFSDDRKYRYALRRHWDYSNNRFVMFIMLNPSSADEVKNDPTIRRCINYAKSWGYGGLIVCNLFALVATNPKDLFKAHNPTGDQNLWYIRKMSDHVDTIVCAWGNYPIVSKYFKHVGPFDYLFFAKDKLHYLELSKHNTPKHPLYLNPTLRPIKIL